MEIQKKRLTAEGHGKQSDERRPQRASVFRTHQARKLMPCGSRAPHVRPLVLAFLQCYWHSTPRLQDLLPESDSGVKPCCMEAHSKPIMHSLHAHCPVLLLMLMPHVRPDLSYRVAVPW